MTYKERIIDVMEQKRITQQLLAEMTGKGKATISRYLTDTDRKTIPNLQDLEDIAKALNISLPWLCFGIGEPGDSTENIKKAAKDNSKIPVYSRAEVSRLIAGELASPKTEITIEEDYREAYAVEYPVIGSMGSRWNCYAVIDTHDKDNWYNEDMVLATLDGNPAPDFYTLIRVGKKIQVYRLEETTVPPLLETTISEIEIIGIVRWGVWERRY